MTLSPGLSMLWEPVDPAAALRERFGFDGLASVTAWVTTTLDEVWGIGVRDCPQLVISSHNAVVWADTPDRRLVIKWSRDEPAFAALDATTGLLRHCDQRGLPVAAPMITLGGADRVVREGPAGRLSIVVTPELTGDWLDIADRQAVRVAGACLAELHETFAGYQDDRLPTTSRVRISPAAIAHWLEDRDQRRAPIASASLERLLDDLPVLDDDVQLVHGDFRAANVLTHDSAVTGILDFDDVALGRRVGDLAQSSVYLGTRFTDWKPTPVAVQHQFLAGYESVRPLSAAERRWYDALLLWLGLSAIPPGQDPAGWGEAVEARAATQDGPTS